MLLRQNLIHNLTGYPAHRHLPLSV